MSRGAGDGSGDSGVVDRTNRIAPVPSTTHPVWRPEPLLVPTKREGAGIDDLDRHICARIAFGQYIDRLCDRYRREFRPSKYAAGTKGSDDVRAALLAEYGGLPKGTRLNDVPAETLERAVGQFGECFGLDVEAVTGNLVGTRQAAKLDPAPRLRAVEAAPW